MRQRAFGGFIQSSQESIRSVGRQVEIVPIAPGMFTENSSGLAGAYAIRVDAQGNQSIETVFTSSNGVVAPTPISLGAPSDQVYLILFGTGFDSPESTSVTIGGLSASVAFAGPQGSTPGLDQVNVLLPHALAGRGSVPVVFTAGGMVSNAIFVAIQEILRVNQRPSSTGLERSKPANRQALQGLGKQKLLATETHGKYFLGRSRRSSTEGHLDGLSAARTMPQGWERTAAERKHGSQSMLRLVTFLQPIRCSGIQLAVTWRPSGEGRSEKVWHS